MMAYQMTFKRYEMKYLLTEEQKHAVLDGMKKYMKLDTYGRTTIRNLYFDTDTFRLIRRSLEKPAYKEKLRIRSYQKVTSDDPVFVELKKKYKSVVYKRRLVLPEKVVTEAFRNRYALPDHSQIGEEIGYFRRYYRTLNPTVFLSYEREAYYALDGSDFRVTFDENILYRQEELSLKSEVYGNLILQEGTTLMEIKTAGGMPLWMSRILTENRIYKTSFSKYGEAYRQIMEGKKLQHGGVQYA